MHEGTLERTDSIVLVTGAARGIGKATVEALVRDHGQNVLAVSRDAAALERSASEWPAGRLQPLALDILDDDAPERIKAAVGGRRVLALVHNAGMLEVRPFGSHDHSTTMRTYAVNVVAPLLITQALIGQLVGDPPGHIVCIGSMGGFQDSAKFPGLAAYSSSKAALACLAQCLAEELKGLGIRSNCLALGSVNTEMLANAFPGYTATLEAKQMGEYIARFALEGGRYFNGKVLPVATTTP